MKLIDAKKLAIELLQKHGLSHYHFQFDNARRRFGYCKRFPNPYISLSAPLVMLNNEDEVRDVILHEIAHALSPKGSGHNQYWKLNAIMVGARPERCYSADKVVMVRPNWIAKCSFCSTEFRRFKIPRTKTACSKCCGGRWQERFVLNWERVK